jgi:hypothetical protein
MMPTEIVLRFSKRKRLVFFRAFSRRASTRWKVWSNLKLSVFFVTAD